MYEERMIELLLLKKSNNISLKEEEELNRLMERYPDAIYHEEFINELWKTVKFKEPNLDGEAYYEKFQQKFKIKVDKQPSRGFNIRKPFQLSKKSVRILIYSAYCFLLFCVAGSVLYYYLEKEEVTYSDGARELVSDKGVRKCLNLPDGTKVWLNADSKLSYDDFTSGAVRAVELEGEAYFDVSKDPERPFVIHTKDIQVRVLGTTFNVKAYPDDNITETSVISGAIELSLKEKPKERMILKSNDKVSIVRKQDDSKAIKARTPSYKLTLSTLSEVKLNDTAFVRETSWVKNRLIFENESMEELIPKLERWYNVEIAVDNPAIYEKRFTGTINEESLEHMLTAMQLIDYFNFKLSGNDLILY